MVFVYNVMFCYLFQLIFFYFIIYVFEVGIMKYKIVVIVVYCKVKFQ